MMRIMVIHPIMWLMLSIATICAGALSAGYKDFAVSSARAEGVVSVLHSLPLAALAEVEI